MVFQDYALYPHADGLREHGVRPQDRQSPRGRDQGARRQGGGDPRARAVPASGSRASSRAGSAQRVAMGRAIVRQPKVFLFDEPLSNLDAKMRGARLEIQKLHGELRDLALRHPRPGRGDDPRRTDDRRDPAGWSRSATPDESITVRRRPSSPASIGSPPMNLVRATGAGLGLQRRRPVAAADDAAAARGRSWWWAFARSTSRLGTDLSAAGWLLRVQALRMLGAERLVYGLLGETLFTARLDATMPPESRRHRRDPCRAVARALVRRRDDGAGRRLRAEACRPQSARSANDGVTTAPWPYPRWIAHRGAGKLAPENTLAAFRLGASHGYRAFECDVKLSADGVFPPPRRDAAARPRATARPQRSPEPTWREARRRQLAQPALCRRAGAELRGDRALCVRNDYALNVEIKPSPGQELGRSRRRIDSRETLGCGGDAAAAQLVPAERCKAHADPRRSCRAPSSSIPCARAGSPKRPRSVASPSSRTTRCSTRRCSPPSTVPACAASSTR